ncbi:MAG: hypothetical protein EA377_13825 [Phycisphaerales bacterium]|nr:MAG: hypothetical protein EA377_13825 [Phycisphaerales bacterium]
MQFLRDAGACAVATEVRCPISRYRFDAAGYRDTEGLPGSDRRRRCEPRTLAVECKQSRADFLRDVAGIDQLLLRQRALHAMRESIERERIPREEPELCIKGSSLFPELAEYDCARSRLPGYRRVLRLIERIELRLQRETKFERLRRYRLADELYLAAPRGMIRRHELPVGWGLLECPPHWLDSRSHHDRLDEPPMLEVTVPAPALSSRDVTRSRLLRNIAAAATAAALQPWAMA